MITDAPRVAPDALRARTGWEIKPEGACKGELCVPLPAEAIVDGLVDLPVFAQRLQMPLVHDEAHDLWALGPESLTGRALASAQAPEVVLPDFEGREFTLSKLRGKKVVLTTWASW